MALKIAQKHLIHEPLFLLHAYVKKFGLIKNLI